MKSILFIASMMLTCICICYGQNTDADKYMRNPEMALNDAKTSFDEGDYDRAVNLIRIYRSLSGNNNGGSDILSNAQKCQQLIDKAEILEGQGDFVEVTECFLSILEINPKDKIAKNRLSGVTKKGAIDSHDYVDLGLSVKWATCNVGASSPSEVGSFVAWGETSPKEQYDWNSYRLCSGSGRAQSKYNLQEEYGIVDNRTRLENMDDVASVKWGGSWRIPTLNEMEELKEQCVWTWTTLDGVKGVKVTSRQNGNSIFLPAGGYKKNNHAFDVQTLNGHYWTSTLCYDYPYNACGIYFNVSGSGWDYGNRCWGFLIRPVTE